MDLNVQVLKLLPRGVSHSHIVLTRTAIVLPDPCLNSPCDANADCTRVSSLNGNFSCTCRAGFTGTGLECSGEIVYSSFTALKTYLQLCLYTVYTGEA